MTHQGSKFELYFEGSRKPLKDFKETCVIFRSEF